MALQYELDSQRQIAFSPKEAAKALSIGRTTLYKEINRGRLRAVKCGRKTLILTKDMNDFIARLEDVKGGSSHDKEN